jgi:hypothetical protein
MAKAVQIPIFILTLSALAGPLRAQHASSHATPSAKKDPFGPRVAAEVHFIAKVCGLQDEEAAELTKAAAERWCFHRSIDLESIVAACQRRAVLTARECDELADVLREQVTKDDLPAYDRRTTFAAVASTPPSRLADVCDEFQRELLMQSLAELRDVVSACEQGGGQ